MEDSGALQSAERYKCRTQLIERVVIQTMVLREPKFQESI